MISPTLDTALELIAALAPDDPRAAHRALHRAVTVCKSDVPGVEAEEVVEMWNRRVTP